MPRKKKEVEKETLEVIKEVYADEWCDSLIPEGATHFRLKVDHSACYYESDVPSYKLIFSKITPSK